MSDGGSTSNARVLREGLPQGSVLAPLLWLIYVNDLEEAVRTAAPSVGLSLFADDWALLASSRSLGPRRGGELVPPMEGGVERRHMLLYNLHARPI